MKLRIQVKDWLARRFSWHGFTDSDLGAIEDSLSGLSLKQTLDAHQAWKHKLQDELAGQSPASLVISEVASDCNCELGKWLHGRGKKDYRKLAAYSKAVKAHADFHISAAEVLIEHQSGNTAGARQLLKSRFRAASNLNQLELVRLFSAASH